MARRGTVLERYRQAGAATVVTASTGNHGAATAWAAERLAMTAVVFAPRDTSRSKLGRMQALGADIRLVGADVDQAKDAARGFADDHRLPFFEDGAEPAQFDGYRAIAREIVQQLGGPRPPRSSRWETARCWPGSGSSWPTSPPAAPYRRGRRPSPGDGPLPRRRTPRCL